MEASLPDKQYYKIGEVSRLTCLNSSVLRFWETEFEQLQPIKSKSGQRLYSRSDLETILLIKRLLYEEKLTIAGARKKIYRTQADLKHAEARDGEDMKRKLLVEVVEELKQLRDTL